MSDQECRTSQETIITLHDLLQLLRGNWRVVAATTLLLAIVGFCVPLTQSLVYEAEATFIDRGAQSVGGSEGLMSLMAGGSRKSSDTITLLSSRKLMERVVDRLGLQGKVTRKEEKPSALRTMWNNWRIYLATKAKRAQPLFPDPEPSLAVLDVQYKLQYPQSIAIEFLDHEWFRAVGQGNKPLGKGRIGEPFRWKGGTFSLNHGPGTRPTTRDRFTVSLTPVSMAAETLEKALTVRPDEDNPKNLLHLSYSHPDRHHAAIVLNTIMEEVTLLLQEEVRHASEVQLDYLNHRQQERLGDLQRIMERHADLCSRDLTSSGFMDSQEQLAFLNNNQKKGKQRLVELQMERSRLESLQQKDDCALYDRWGTTADSDIINQSLQSIRALRQQRDRLDLALQKSSRLSEEEVEACFVKQVEELERLRNDAHDAKAILASLDDPDQLPSDNRFLQRSDTLAPLWFRHLQESHRYYQEAHPGERHKSQQEYLSQRERFTSYMRNISRVLDFQERILQERLAHQRNPREDLRGIDLPMAEQLYLHYTKRLDDLEVELRQQQFVLERAKDPLFDLTALCIVGGDEITRGIVNRVSQLQLQLQDAANRSEKELERLRAEVEVQRAFLSTHLQQSIDLLVLQRELVLDKVEALQNVSLDLLHQQISVEEQNLADYITTRLDNIDQETCIQRDQLRELEEQMATLPEKWVSERLLQEEVNANQRVVRQVAQLVESKILQKNLEIIQSAPLDLALAPILPTGPRIKLYVAAGTMLGLLFSLTAVLAIGIARGIPLSAETLRSLGHHVSGTLSSKVQDSTLNDDDLTTLRRAITHCCSEGGSTKHLLTVEGGGSCFSPAVASLLSKRGHKVLLIPLTLVGGDEEHEPGVLQVATGESRTTTVLQEDGYDRLPGGGRSRFAGELANSTFFRQFLEKQTGSYDWIVLSCRESAASAAAEALLPLAHSAMVRLQGETGEDIATYLQTLLPTTYIF